MSINSVQNLVGKAWNARQYAGSCQKYVKKLAPARLEKLNKCKEFMGSETLNILINAIGTALIAPIFIAFNPFSKADEKTKKYCALRQPISAGIAVGTQCAATIPWAAYMANKLNTGLLGKFYDKRAMQDGKFIEKNLLKNKEFLEKNPDILKTFGFKGFINKVKSCFSGSDAFKNSVVANEETVGKAVNEIAKNQYLKAAERLLQTDKIMANATEEILSKEETRDLMLSTLNSIKKTAGQIDETLIKPVQDAIISNKSVKEVIKSAEGLCKKLNIDFLNEILTKHGNNVTSRAKWVSAVTGMVISTIITCYTSSLLNWAHPKFIKTFFPHLEKKDPKKAQGGKQ